MPQQSFLLWVSQSLGIYSVLLILSLMFSFVVTALLVWKARGAMFVLGLLFVVPIPLWVGILGTLLGYVQIQQVVAHSVSAPSPEMLAEGYSTALVSTYVGAVLVIPNLLLALIGMFFRGSSAKAPESATNFAAN